MKPRFGLRHAVPGAVARVGFDFARGKLSERAVLETHEAPEERALSRAQRRILMLDRALAVLGWHRLDDAVAEPAIDVPKSRGVRWKVDVRRHPRPENDARIEAHRAPAVRVVR